jgi:gluconolactonase
MRLRKIICFAVGAMLAATATGVGETVIVSNVLGPEGPLYVDGNLYYVGWVSNTLSKWDGKTSTALNHTPGCGHNGLALTKRKTFLLACTEEHGAILSTISTGATQPCRSTGITFQPIQDSIDGAGSRKVL